MTTTRKTYSPKFKARVVIEVLRSEKTLKPVGLALQSRDMFEAVVRKTMDRLSVRWKANSGRRTTPSAARVSAQSRLWYHGAPPHRDGQRP
jgi:hypothetical protein